MTQLSWQTKQEMAAGQMALEHLFTQDVVARHVAKLRRCTGADILYSSYYDKMKGGWFAEVTACALDNGQRVPIFKHSESINVFPSDELIAKLALVGGGRDTRGQSKGWSQEGPG